MAHASNWNKFVLLLWKNWKLQFKHIPNLILVILLPPLFVLLLWLLRLLLLPNMNEELIFSGHPVDSLDAFLTGINPSQMPEMLLMYSPKNPELDKLVGLTAGMLNLRYTAVKNMKALESDVISNRAIAGIEFNDNLANIKALPQDLEYRLRFPSKLREAGQGYYDWNTNDVDFVELLQARQPNFTYDSAPSYMVEGFLTIQNLLFENFLYFKKNKNYPFELEIRRYPYPAHLSDLFLYTLDNILSLLVVCGYIYSAISIIKFVTYDKEKQLKEVMKLIGLDNWLHWLAWFVKSFIILLIATLLVTFILTVKFKNNVGVLNGSNWFLIFLFLAIYCIALICLCFMLSACFSSCSLAAAVSSVILIISIFPYSFIYKELNGSRFANTIVSLVPNSAIYVFFTILKKLEFTGEGLQWNNLFKTSKFDHNPSVGVVMIMLLISAGLFMLICLYIEQIYPGEFGIAKKWYFPFQSSFWCPRKAHERDVGGHESDITFINRDAFEREPDDKPIGVQVKNLTKVFDDKIAVNGVSLNFFEDEITMLLGHNGAGKTTTISILTGMFPPTSGTAIVNGFDIRTNIDDARLSLGICPQHNILFEDLTVTEHLWFFCKVKGLSRSEINAEIDKFLKLIELEDKARNPVKTLSGGMQRKLSVCCALCGHTKVVFCDEPSSGMDPFSRRKLWDLLQLEKKGRTLVLTTHFMDEADVLGDRVAIISQGEIKCYGTSFFLKKKFGSGYKLICAKNPSCNTKEVTKIIRRYIPNVQPISDIGYELTYELPEKYSSKFEEMFTELENNSKNLNVEGYGVGITSMEEVFIKVGAEHIPSNSQPLRLAGGSTDPDNNDNSVPTQRYHTENSTKLSGTDLIKSQMHSMFLKRALYMIRHKIMLLPLILLPLYFTIDALTQISTKPEKGKPPLKIDLPIYSTGFVVIDESVNNTIGKIGYNISTQYKALINSYGSNFTLKTTNHEPFLNYILDLGETIQQDINALYLAAASISDNKITAWVNNQRHHTAPVSLNLVHNAIARALIGVNTKVIVTNAPLPYDVDTVFRDLFSTNLFGTALAYSIATCMCFLSPLFILLLIKERNIRFKLLQFITGVSPWIFWVSHFLYDIIIFLFPALVTVIVLACYQPDGFKTFTELGCLFMVLILFSFAMLAVIYLLSFLFNEPTSAYNIILITYLFVGPVAFLVLITLIYLEPSKDVDRVVRGLTLFPHFALAMAISKMYANKNMENICQDIGDMPRVMLCELYPDCCNVGYYFTFGKYGFLYEILCLIGIFIIIFLLLLTIDTKLMVKVEDMINYREVAKIRSRNVEDDVDAEQKRVSDMSTSEKASKNLVLDGVTKSYGPFVAVKNMSLCVEKSECFGLLGVNGAGKTTTFKMMTGDIIPSSGTVLVQGLNVTKSPRKVYTKIGYCPQFDALLDEFTGRETLKMFCMLRGVPKSRINYLSEMLAKALGFHKHLDKRVKAYSGGNKRKLSTAIAIIGDPSVIYLDEPTTGLDPVARRQFWNNICYLRDSGKSIVLTSHNMEECEALCTRLGIMVNGELKCIGSTQHLKNKYSKGFVLKIKLVNLKEKRIFSPNQNSVHSTTASESTLKRRDPHDASGSQTPIPYDPSDSDMESSLSTSNIPINEEPADIISNIEGDYAANVKEFVYRNMPQSELAEEYQGVLTFHIPMTAVKWSTIFGLMERHRNELNIEDYYISQTKLDDIFLQFGELQYNDMREMKTPFCC